MKQTTGARPFGMGEAFTGLCDDMNAIMFNPGGLGNLKYKEAGAMWIKAIEGTNQGSIGYAHPTERVGTFGMSAMLFDAGKFTVNDEGDINHEDTIGLQKDMLLVIGYAYRFGRVSPGINIKRLSSTLLERYKTSVIAIDAGLFVRTGLFKNEMSFESEGINLGAAIQNLGGEITYDTTGDPLPMTVRAGFSYSMKFEKHRIIAAADVLKPNDSVLKEYFGLEYSYKDMVSVRAGYRLGRDIDALTFGVGMIYKLFLLDYGIALSKEMSYFHRISFNLKFGVEYEETEDYF